MTYLEFLVIFLVFPILLLGTAHLRMRQGPRALWVAVGVQVALALAYTTPWDNYLVASGVWFYDPQRVSGILIGYVPLEEYIFFILETVLVGLWWQFVWTRQSANRRFEPSTRSRLFAVLGTTALWLLLMAVFFSSWKPGTYLLITLIWALPPILIQLTYGADILWQRRGLLAAVILPLGLYLSAADAWAIRSGVWTIDPAQSTGLFIGSLPVEEGVFFFVTCILIAFGLTLTLAPESRERFIAWKSRLMGKTAMAARVPAKKRAREARRDSSGIP